MSDCDYGTFWTGKGRNRWGLGVSGFGEEREGDGGGDSIMTSCWLSEFMSPSSPSTLSSRFHFPPVSWDQAPSSQAWCSKYLTSGMACQISVWRSWWGPGDPFLCQMLPLLIAGSVERIARWGRDIQGVCWLRPVAAYQWSGSISGF